MTMRIGPKGQVVIPKHYRDALGLRPGDEVDWALVDGTLTVEPVEDHGSMRGQFAGLGLVAELQKDRQRERDR
jgi:AbrB family looped-hinge helix DNA binding protein